MLRSLSYLLLIVFLAGCVAGQASYSQGKKALDGKDYDQAVADFLAAVEKNPHKPEFRLNLMKARNLAAEFHQGAGNEFFQAGNYREAIREYQLANDLDASLFAAADGLRRSRNFLQAGELVKDAGILLENNRYAQAGDAIGRALALVPDYQPALQMQATIKRSQFAVIDGVELEVTSTDPINLNFQNARIPDVFNVLTKLSGINFILDEDVRNDRTSLFLEQATFAQALELLLRMNKLDKKVLNSKTIILFPKTRDKQKQFEDQIIQTFYLSHIDAKKAVNLLRTMLQVRKIYVQEELNAIVLRDQPDVIRLAQKMLEANDRGNSEVVFDLELLEVNHSDTRELGLKLSNYSMGAGLSIENSGLIANSGLTAGGSTDNLVDFTKNLDPFYAIPTATFRLMKTLVDAEVLANPKIRVRNQEKASVHVGSREPVITVTLNDTQTSENVQYIDVGVKLDVEPTIQLDRTIVTKLGLEVSNVSGREKTANGTAVITISSTNANTTLTLKDGEQTIIGGLIRNDNSVTKNKIPLLGDIPLVGEIFNGTDKSKVKREILLSITPHIVKLVAVPHGDTASIWSGGEDDLKFGRNFGSFVDEYKAGQAGVEPQAEDTPENGDEKAEVVPDQEPAPTDVPEVILDKNSPAGASTGGTLFLTGPHMVTAGSDFQVSLRVAELAELGKATLHLAFDPALIEFVNAERGTLLEQPEQPVNLMLEPAASGDALAITIAPEGKSLTLAEGSELLTLKFRAMQAGRTDLKPSGLDFVDGQGKPLSPLVNDFPVEIR